MSLFRKLPSFSKNLGRLPTARPPSRRNPTVSRYRVPQPDAGPSFLESRAAQDITATLPERIVIQELRRRNESFEFQDQFGGKLFIGGMSVDIIIYSRTPYIALEILSDWNRPPLANPSHEPLKAAMVEAMGYRFASLNDDTDIFPSRQRLETLLDEILGQSIPLFGIPSGGSSGGPGGGVAPPTGDDEAMAMLEIAKLRGELASLRALVDNHGARHNVSGTDAVRRAGQVSAVLKTLNETVSDSAALQDDDELVFDIPANILVHVTIFLYYSSSVVADLKVGWSVPAGVSLLWFVHSGAAPFADTNEGQTRVLDGSGVTTNQWAVISGVVSTAAGGSPGRVTFRWAQNTAEVSNTVVRAGSCMLVAQQQ